MRQLLAALGDNVKPLGKNWTARCPVHNDADFAMSIKQLGDGSVLAHCHACGANGLDLYQALHLDLEELFGFKDNRSQDYVPNDVRELLGVDKMVVKMFERQRDQGGYSNLEDKRRYKLARGRIIGVQQKYGL